MKGSHQVVCAAVILVFMAALLAGCGRAREAAETARDVGEAARIARDMQDGEATIKTDEGEAKISVDKDGEQVTWKTTDEEGREATFTIGQDVDLSELGVALYPGATQEMSTSATGTDRGGMTVALSTPDSFEQVADFYKDKYPGVPANEMAMGEANMLMLEVSEEPSKTVTVTRRSGDDKTNITIVSEAP